MKAILTVILAAILQAGPFLNQIQKRDSVLIADQLEYGVNIENASDTVLYLWPQLQKRELMPDIYVGEPWQIDTVNLSKNSAVRSYGLRGRLVIQPFAEGHYDLPPIQLLRHHPDGSLDTLTFEGLPLDVCTIPIDTTTFVPHDIRPQIKYPVTFKEVLPWVLGGLGGIALIVLIVFLVRRYLRRKNEGPEYKEPAHIRAFRKLDKFRGNKYWAPDKQKTFYSGVTDALREYIASRYEVGAMEMTTAEIFNGLKASDMPPGTYTDLKDLFERSDFVKFAKYVATDEENASVMPLAVRFVSETYIREEEENKEEKQ